MSFDPVNKPSHYAEGRRFEVVDVLTDWVSRAPGPVEGSLQWSACKYLGRLWDKGNPLQDARKARWYLDRLIAHLEGPLPFDASDSLYDEVLADYGWQQLVNEGPESSGLHPIATLRRADRAHLVATSDGQSEAPLRPGQGVPAA